MSNDSKLNDKDLHVLKLEARDLMADLNRSLFGSHGSVKQVSKLCSREVVRIVNCHGSVEFMRKLEEYVVPGTKVYLSPTGRAGKVDHIQIILARN